MNTQDAKILEAYEGIIKKAAGLNESLDEATKPNYTLLKAKIVGTMEGKISDHPYRAVMWQNKKGNWMFQIEQGGEKGQWHGAGPGWYLSDIISKGQDFIYIDAGQKWGVKGIKAAAKEALSFI
jgi:hypothetical protein